MSLAHGLSSKRRDHCFLQGTLARTGSQPPCVVSMFADCLKVMLGLSIQDQVGAHENLQSLSLPCSAQGVLPPPPGL